LAKTPKAEIDRRVEETAELLQLTDELERRPAQLSGGQRQRVAMGRAIIRHPQAFLMDEPLSNLDAKLRVEMRAEIARLQRELAVTTVYVTHDQVEAMTMGTRVAVLQKGRLQQVATPQRLYDEPDNLFVATFIGSPAMNLFPGHIEASDSVDGTDGRLTLCSGQHRLALDSATVESHPALLHMVGQPVVVGIRPEGLADVALEPGVPADRVIEATVDLVESLGAELIVHVTVSDPVPPAPDGVSDAWRQVVARRGRAVARLSTRSRLSTGDVVKLAVDTTRLHLFDAETGASLRTASAA
ncbi:MAG TPA: ATP-binding cassette domain-containing protein, partial [Acidimicrobiales bacterium]